jgi:hypothetical protein
MVKAEREWSRAWRSDACMAAASVLSAGDTREPATGLWQRYARIRGALLGRQFDYFLRGRRE